MTYTVEVRPRALKQLGSLPKGLRASIAQAIDALATVPRPPGAVQQKGTAYLRVRVRDYRIVYEVHDDVLLVLVVRVAHRRDVYRGI